jgi:site-specific recombinase XerD
MSDTGDSEGRRRGKRRERGIFQRHSPGCRRGRDCGCPWWVVYFDEHGRRHREKVGARGLAVKVYQKRKNEIQERRFFPERIRRREVLLADVVRDYLAREKGRMRSFVNYERYGRYWSDAFPGRTLRQIIPGDIERYVARRTTEGMAPASVNRELTFLRRLFNVAIADGLIDTNPVCAVKFFKENNQRVRFLSDDEETRLQASIGEEHWPLVAVAIHTGLRQSEQFHLRWEHVDFATGILTVPRSKHGEARRLPMNDTVRDMLRSRPSRLKSPYVSPSATGETPLDAKNFLHRVFLPALKGARIEGFRWHDLRHSFASRLVMKGVDLRTVQELMGHKTQAMTLRYSHLSPEHQLDAVQRLNRPASATATATEAQTAKVASEAGGKVVDLPTDSNEPCWDRTSDPLLKRQMLYRLS